MLLTLIKGSAMHRFCDGPRVFALASEFVVGGGRHMSSICVMQDYMNRLTVLTL